MLKKFPNISHLLLASPAAFEGPQLYVGGVEGQAASSAGRKANRALFDSFHVQRKRRKEANAYRIVEYFEASYRPILKYLIMNTS